MTEKTAKNLLECREIVKEILNYGVSQFQILNIIHLLSLEIENRDAMLEIAQTTKNFLSENEQEGIIT